MTSINSAFTGKVQNYHHHEPQNFQNVVKEMNNGDLHSSKRISSNFDEEIPLINKNRVYDG